MILAPVEDGLKTFEYVHGSVGLGVDGSQRLILPVSPEDRFLIVETMLAQTQGHGKN